MKAKQLLELGALAAAALSCSLSAAAAAATLIPILPVQGSDPNSTGVFGINKSNIIVGFYTTDNYAVRHGFLGTLDGNYTTFDYGGNATGTTARAINDDNWVTGIADDEDCPLIGECEFVRQPDGTILNIEKDGVPLEGTVQGITAKEKLVGDYYTPDFHHYGYYGKAANYVKDLTLPCCTSVRPRAINRSGAVAGFYTTRRAHGFLLQNGIVTKIDYPDPNAYYTFPEGLNDGGLVAGNWNDKRQKHSYAFEVDTTTMTFTPINIPGATYTQAWGVNNAGLVAVGSDAGVFIYCPHAKNKCPASARAIEIPDMPTIRIRAEHFRSADCARNCTNPESEKAEAMWRRGAERMLRKHPLLKLP